MARSKSASNGRFDEAFNALALAQATLVQNQAVLQLQLAESARRMDEHARRMDETDRVNSQRFFRIETILMDLTRLLERLPEAVREKIGFKVSDGKAT